MGADLEELGALARDVYGHTLRGMAISVAGLRWFGRGLDLGPECEPLRDKTIKIISRLRSKGATSKSDLLRNFHLKKHERDPLLARLVEERIIRVDGKEVAATTYGEFVEGLYGLEEFPQVKAYWPEVQGALKAGSK